MTVTTGTATIINQVEHEATTTTSLNNGGQSLLVSVEQAAEILGIGRTRFFDLVMSHAVSSVKIGRRRLIVRSSLAQYVERLVREQYDSEENRAEAHHGSQSTSLIACAAASRSGTRMCP
jgi:excisionase family DNA binding protein